jgi:hypothetical protein
VTTGKKKDASNCIDVSWVANGVWSGESDDDSASKGT